MKRTVFAFIAVTVLLISTVVYAATTGTLAVTPWRLVEGLWSGEDAHVDIIKDLRLPRIIIALFAGASLSVAGVLLQAVMRNPLAEPGIIGVSSGASFFAVLFVTLVPSAYFYAPLVSVIGGGIAFLLVYTLSWKNGLDPLRMILIGIAINALFTSFSQVLHFMGGLTVGTSDAATSNLAMRQWADVSTISVYATIGLLLACFVAKGADQLALSDATARSLGVPVNRLRFVLAAIAVLLASVATAVAGLFVFVGLLVPHMSRRLVGTSHRVLIPFSALLGAWLIVLSDTIGRLIIHPNELPASVIVALIGGPFLIFLLRKGDSFAAR